MNYHVPKNTMTRTLEDGTIALDADSGRYIVLNEVGGRIWELLTAGESTERIIQILEAEYDAPHDTIQSDLEGLLVELAQRGMVLLEE